MENLPGDFNWIIYNELNPDLRDIVDGQSLYYDEEKCKIHYLRHGFFEGIKYKVEVPNDFNWIIYNELNPDLRDVVDGESVYYDEEKCKIHYVRHGYFEGRKYKEEFNPDAMIEHVFERLWISSIINSNDNYMVLDKND